MFLYGFHPVREALRHRPHDIVRVLVARGRAGARRDQVAELCLRHRIEIRDVPERELAALAGPAHNGLVAEVREAAAAAEAPTADADFRVLLEDVQDPRNLGAVLRVCEGAGVGQVMIRDRGAAPISPTVVKTSAGASEWLAIERITNSAMAIAQLKKEGFWIYGTDAEGDPPWEIDLTGKIVICLGGEENGLRDLTRKSCDRLIGLPMRGHVESLNIATATAAVLYEAVRQRVRALQTTGKPK
ncbi:MAG TPA: 23S rRNA (guanosine(2251)-2'-O)-methyltransferase RlmB [Thermoanaerobaculia bacterium]|jgi:23S rRNA (guanosine2251-2'-O)-methyltransferase|nr:23S rRNA (guanosine(2251)-2'-O)-methyltransferase RlmB [Thermoanaerobaculia bacterium]